MRRALYTRPGLIVLPACRRVRCPSGEIRWRRWRRSVPWADVLAQAQERADRWAWMLGDAP